MSLITIIFYTTKTGKKPFLSWQEDLDTKAKAIVISRMARVRASNFGDCKYLTNAQGLWELRIDYGSGYRIYFGKQGTTIVVLLMGGDKKTQTRDIAKAKQYWLEYKESLNE